MSEQKDGTETLSLIHRLAVQRGMSGMEAYFFELAVRKAIATGDIDLQECLDPATANVQPAPAHKM